MARVNTYPTKTPEAADYIYVDAVSGDPNGATITVDGMFDYVKNSGDVILADGTVAMTGNLDLGNNDIDNASWLILNEEAGLGPRVRWFEKTSGVANQRAYQMVAGGDELAIHALDDVGGFLNSIIRLPHSGGLILEGELNAAGEKFSNVGSIEMGDGQVDTTLTRSSAGVLAVEGTPLMQADGSVAMTGNLDMGTGNITNVGTVDGRDVSVDGTKLDTIATGAQTGDFLADGTVAMTGNMSLGSNDINSVNLLNKPVGFLGEGGTALDHTVMASTVLNTAFESGGVTSPLMVNDIAYLRTREDGLVTITTSGAGTFSGDPDDIFRPNGSFYSVNGVANTDTITIEITLPTSRQYQYGQNIGIAFGADFFEAKDITIDYDQGAGWVNVVSNKSPIGASYQTKANGEATALQKIRYTLTNLGGSVRIAHCWMASYNSEATPNLFISGEDAKSIVALTQAEYDALTPVATTLYLITG
jgi:hypothetical protein